MESTRTDEPAAEHDVFISYSRVDRAFAVALEAALERYRPPRGLRLPHRYLDVFRDEQDFTGTEYTSALARHVGASRKLIVVCSPAARASRYVDEEVRLFAAARGAEHVIPILLAGTPNNESANPEDPNLAFPQALCDVMAVPLAASYRGCDPARQSVRRGLFEGAWLTVLANLFGVERTTLEQRERRRQLRALQLWISTATAIVLVLSGLTVWALLSRTEAMRQRDVAEQAKTLESIAAGKEKAARVEAEAERQRALTQQLAAQAEATINQQPNRLERSVLLALEALHPDHAPAPVEAYAALRHGLRLLPPRPGRPVPIDSVRMMAQSPDGGFLVTLTSGRGEHAITLWKPGLNAPLAELRESETGQTPSLPVKSLAVGRDGRHVALLRASGVDIWNPNSNSTVLTRLAPGIREPTAARFSEDGARLAVIGYAGGLVRVWNAETWDQKGNDVSAPATAIAFTPAGALVVASRAQTIGLDLDSDARTMVCTSGARTLGALSSNARHAAYLDDTGTIRVFRLGADKASCVERARILPQEGVTALAVTSGGDVVAVASADGTARLWTIPALRELAWMTHRTGVTSMEFDPAGHHLVTVERGGTVRRWEVVESTETRGFNHASPLGALAFGPDASSLATATIDGAVQRWSLAQTHGESLPPHAIHNARLSTNDLRGSGTTAPEIRYQRFSPGGRFFAMVNQEATLPESEPEMQLHVWNVLTGGERTMPLTSDDVNVEALAISDDGVWVALVIDGALHLIDATGRGNLEGAPAATGIGDVAFEPGGRRLATIESDGTVALRDPATRSTTRLAAGAKANSLVWSLSGRHLAITAENRVLVLDARSGQVTSQTALDQAGTVRALSTDGTHVATLRSGGASVWNLSSRREVAYVTQSGGILEVVFSLDGSLLATSGASAFAYVWRWRTEDLFAAACGRLSSAQLDAADWSTFLGSARLRPTCPAAELPAAQGRSRGPGD